MPHGAPIVAEPTSVDDVVRRAQAGDVTAFEIVYRTHAPSVFVLCRRLAGNERDARELTQDVFVQAWQRLQTFRGQSALGTWLHRIAVNVMLERVRASNRRSFVAIDGEDAPPLASRSPNLDDRIDLDAAITKLAAGARTVFVLHDMYGYSHDEIAQLTGIAPGTARAQLWRARRALLEALDR